MIEEVQAFELTTIRPVAGAEPTRRRRRHRQGARTLHSPVAFSMFRA